MDARQTRRLVAQTLIRSLDNDSIPLSAIESISQTKRD